MIGFNMDGQKFDNKHSGISENTSSNQDESNIGGIGEDLNEHVESIHKRKKNFVCSECQKAFFMAHHLKNHFERMHEDNKFQCDTCDNTLKSKYDLKNMWNVFMRIK